MFDANAAGIIDGLQALAIAPDSALGVVATVRKVTAMTIVR